MESAQGPHTSTFMQFVQKHFMLLLWSGVSSVLFLPNLLTRGLFVDGLVYSSISRNLTRGLGSMWSPYYAEVKGDVFVEHPPLFFWLQSIWFQLTGDHVFTERLFSFLCYLVTSFLVFRFFQLVFKARNASFFAMVLVTVTPIVYWAFGNNMMEMLLVAPVVGACHILYRRYTISPHWWDLPFISLLFLFFLLIKGPVALGMAVLPFTFLFTVSFSKVLKDGLLLLLLSGVALVLLLQSEAAYANLNAYLEAQIIGVLSGDRSGEFAPSRWKLMKDLGQQLIIPFALPLGLWLLNRKRVNFGPKTYPLLLTALLFSLPFLISRKQHAYYLVPALCFFALFAAALFQDAFQKVLSYREKMTGTVAGLLGLSAVLVGTVLMLVNLEQLSRDSTTQKDLITLDEALPLKRVGLEDDLHENWSLYGYAMRFHGIDLSSKDSLSYLVASKEKVAGYERMNLPTQKFHLFKKKGSLPKR